MTPDDEQIYQICAALGQDGYYVDGVLRYSLPGSGRIEIVRGHGFSTLYDGTWQVSGEARQCILRALKRAHLQASAILDAEKAEAARKHNDQVAENNAHVLATMVDDSGVPLIISLS